MTVAFALSGLIAAARKKLYAVGVCVLPGLAAFGGGALRDKLLDRRPFFWVEHANWLSALPVSLPLPFMPNLQPISVSDIHRKSRPSGPCRCGVEGEAKGLLCTQRAR